MSKLGKLLQQTRRKKKLTIDKVCDLTKMSKSHIYALESTNVKAFPAEMYYKGFLRTYAQILELDEKEIIKMYEQEKQEETQGDLFSFAQEQQEQQTQQLQQKQNIKEVKEKKKQNNKLKQDNVKKDDTRKYLIAILSVVFVLIIIFSLIFLKQNNIDLIDNKAQVNSQEQQEQNNLQQKQSLVIQTTMDTWVKIIADYQKIFEDTIPANTKKEFFAEDNFVIKVGNVDGAVVYFNGKLIDITTNVTPNRTKILTLKKENNLEK